MSKNIVVLCDGTGQDGGRAEGENTNIYKLFNMLEDRTPRQVVFYDRGLGTGVHRLTGNVGGMGISRNIRECYEFIFDEYQGSASGGDDGDRIFLFGFSRGAATVRSLSAFIHYFGILPKSRPELIPKAYGIYKQGKFVEDEQGVQRLPKADEFIDRHHTMWAKVHFLGCFDTVAALGLPFKWATPVFGWIPFLKHRFHNFKLSKSVTNAYHALAIDDERETFHPVLWDQEVKPYQNLKQVWFCGMHTDVGGGYTRHELSDIPLTWMVDMAVRNGLLIHPGCLKELEEELTEDPNGHMHNSRGKPLTRLYRPEVRSWPSKRKDQPVVHKSVLERKRNAQNGESPGYRSWIHELEYEVEPWVRFGEQDWSAKGSTRNPSPPQSPTSPDPASPQKQTPKQTPAAPPPG